MHKEHEGTCCHEHDGEHHEHEGECCHEHHEEEEKDEESKNKKKTFGGLRSPFFIPLRTGY